MDTYTRLAAIAEADAAVSTALAALDAAEAALKAARIAGNPDDIAMRTDLRDAAALNVQKAQQNANAKYAAAGMGPKY